MEQQTTVSLRSAPIERLTFSQEQVQLIRSQIAPNAKPAELELFLYQCRRAGLDPLAKQIYCIHRGGKMTIQTSIDGFRVIAERSGDYAGQDEPQWAETENGQIIKCRVTVYRFSPTGQRYPAGVGVAYFSEYNAGGPMWQKMPHTMIAKCAEALALRKAYPQDLSGLYTNEEMQQAERQEEPQQQWQQAQPANMEDESVARARKAVDEAISGLNQCDSMADIEALERSYTNPESIPNGQTTDWLPRVKRYKEAKAAAVARIEATEVSHE